jgi:hypothetical protein
MGAGSVHTLGKSELPFNHILSRLQGELQKSRETSAELYNLTGAMNGIHDTLGGPLVSCSAVLYIPTLVKIIMLVAAKSTALPVHSPSLSASYNTKSRSTWTVHISPPLALFIKLQSQLHETHSIFSLHPSIKYALETVFAEHNAIKRKVGALRQLVEKRDRENGDFGAVSGTLDDGDTRSIRTIVPHELDRVEEEDEDQIMKQEEWRWGGEGDTEGKAWPAAHPWAYEFWDDT